MSIPVPAGRVLRLTLSKEPFEIMLAGEKNVEYRKPNPQNGLKWILSRLQGKSYDWVLFTNGYDPTSPWFVTPFLGWDTAPAGYMISWRNLRLAVNEGDVRIYLGPVHSSGNHA